MTSTAPAGPSAAPGPEFPIAGMDRRFYGFVLDRLLVWTVYVVAAYAAYRWLIHPGQTWAGAGAIVGTVLLVGLVTSVAVGLTGATPANLAVGLRIVAVQGGGPIGVGRAMLRTFVLGVATLPTFGFGAAALAVTAVGDPTGRRRGWHDLRARSVVVDVRPEPVETVTEEPKPAQVVNLTALRLVPASPTPPSHIPARRAKAPAKPLPPRLGPATPSATAPITTPRQGLGWPLVGTAPDEQHAAPATLGPTTPGSAPAPTRAAPPVADPAAQPSTAAVVGAPPEAQPPAPAPASPSASELETAAAAQPAAPPLPVPSTGPGERADGPRPETPRPAGGARRAVAGWQVTFDTGERFQVSGLTLVGRRPEARPGEPVKQLVALPSEDMSLSKTHAQFQVVPDGALVVMDRGSTNGSILIRAGVTKKLESGRPQTLRDQDRVHFGDREMTVARVHPAG